jgi:capsular exopolysaccharide synthesis family protein
MKYQKSYKEVVERIVKSWYLLVIFALLGMIAAIFYNRNSLPSYQVTTTLLYKSNTQSQQVFSDKPIAPGKRPSLENQVGIISSYSLVHKTLQNLKWTAFIAEKGIISNKDLFTGAPFEIAPDTTAGSNLLDVQFTLTPVSETEYTVSADGEYEKGGVKRQVQFTGQGKIGQPFKNNLFHFTVKKARNSDWTVGQDYLVRLADLNMIALDYQKKLDIKLADRESDLIYVSMQSKNVERAVDFLNELVKVYVQFGIDEKNKQADNTISFIDNQIFGIKDSLQRAGNNLSGFRSATRAVDIGKESGIALERYQAISTQESSINTRLQYYTNLRQSLNDANGIKNLAPPSVVGVNDPALTGTILKLTDLTSQREVLSHTLQEGNPALESLDKEITFTRNALAKNIDNLLLSARLELNTLNQQKYSINSRLASLPKEEQSLIGIQGKFELNNQLYTYLLQKRAEAGIIKASNFSDIEVLDPASDDTAKPLGHNRLVNVAIGIVAGLTLIILYFLVHSQLDKRIYNMEQIYQSTYAKVFGLIYKNTLKTPLPVLLYPQSSITESFRSLRTNIHQYLTKHPGQKVISLNSCVVGEGKTFVTLNLATIFAKNSKRVLVIDTDLRKPKLHKLLGCTNEVGLSDYLKGSRRLQDVIRTTDNNDLFIISAGPSVPFPSEMITNGKLEILLQDVREQFDYVILKNAPAGIITDSRTIFPLADLNLFVVKMMASTADQLEYINGLTKDFPSQKFGIVINSVKNTLISKEKSFGYYSEKRVQETEGNGVEVIPSGVHVQSEKTEVPKVSIKN